MFTPTLRPWERFGISIPDRDRYARTSFSDQSFIGVKRFSFSLIPFGHIDKIPRRSSESWLL